jgi:hypothetical protein
MLVNFLSSWKEIKGGEMARKAVIMFPHGYQIQLLPKA